jgi:DNA polymerase-1
MASTVYFDLEGCSADAVFTHKDSKPYVRLCGAVKDDGEKVGITTDPQRLINLLDKADVIVGHNIINYDLMALAKHEGADYDRLCAKAVDTYVVAKTDDPPVSKHAGQWGVKGYYGLDSLAGRMGVRGKITGDDGLVALALEFGPQTGAREDRMKAGFGMIPVNDARYRAYLEQDVRAQRDTSKALPALTPYLQREMRVAHFQNRMTFSGWRVDEELLAERVEAENRRRTASLEWLHEHCDVPLTELVGHGRGKARVFTEEEILSPLGTKVGKQALIKAFAAAGAPYYPRTASGELALSKDAMGEGSYMVGKGAKGRLVKAMLNPEAYGRNAAVREICRHISVVNGTVAKYGEIAKFVVDGRVHASVGGDQASGRWAYVKPSNTNLGKRGGKVIQRAVYLPDEGDVLLAIDLDQVDMRAIAAHCQDPAYMALFAPGMDAHSMIADQVFGRHDGEWRDRAKATGHGWNYGLGLKGMVNSGIAEEVGAKFISGMERAFPGLMAWRKEIRDQATDGAMLDNGFGRKMRCLPANAYTEAPALMGQGTARDLMAEALLRAIDAIPECITWMRGVVHDECVFSVPADSADEIGARLKEAMTFNWRGVDITCGLSKPGTSWADCYRKD